MNISTLQLVFFSPTGTTRTIIEEIARGIGHPAVERVDITRQDSRKRLLEASGDDLLVVGVPVYVGRAQEHAIDWLRRIKGNHTPAVAVVVYGNREFDDALLELKQTLAGSGFLPVAGAAFIGEHSFSSPETPIAPGRPDAGDLALAFSFGGMVRAKLSSIPSAGSIADLPVPGSYPYTDITEKKKILSGIDLVAVGQECAHCGECARACPVGAIDPENSARVDTGTCIVCHACVKVCPTGARTVKNEMVKSIAQRLSGTLQARKEPRLFL
ncbi:MAG: 4Fe-4S binding protein [Desulfobacteraceae bacterium]|nr:4Fe-4S binding protein [Desulfobacteraceae bacterium]